MLSHVTRLLLVIVAFATFTTACHKKPAPRVINFGNGAEPQDLDPQIVTGTPEQRLMNALFEGLVIPSPTEENGFEPGVAESWDISPDGCTYTFHLRHDAKWSNGDPITSEDFIASAKRMLTPSLAADYVYMFFYVKGAEAYYQGEIKDFTKTGFAAPAVYTLVLTLNKPTPFFLSLLTHNSWYPVPVRVISKFGGLDRKGTAWTRPENFVCNGPFMVKAWQPGQKIVTVKSPHYWDRAHVGVDEIHFHAVERSDTEERMFRTGQLDITNDVPLSKIPVYQRDHPDELRIEPFNCVYFYRFNTTRKPFNDVRVRRALALAIDRENLVKKVTLAGETPARQIVPPGFGGYHSTYQLEGNIDEARRLLAEAGYPEGRGFPHAELLFNTMEKHQTIAESIQQMWRKNLGIEINLRNVEWRVYVDAQKRGQFDLQRSGWVSDYLDPHGFFDIWRSDSGNNNSGWGSAEYDHLLDTALDAPTNAERHAIYQRMEKILIDELPVLPLYFYTRARLINPKVTGYHTNLLDNYPWKYAGFKD